MKKHKLFAALAPAAMLAAAMLFFSPTASAQVTVERRPGQRPAPVQSPVITAPDISKLRMMSAEEVQEILVKRLDALEAENKELKSQLKGLNAQVEAFKAQFASHTHDLSFGASSLETVKKDPDVLVVTLASGWSSMFSRKTGPPTK